jgi:hypothetical protein
MANTIRVGPRTPPQTPPRRPAAREEPEAEVTSVSRLPEEPSPRKRSPVEITVVHRRGLSQVDASDEWVALEVWTRNRVYLLNGTFTCIGVVNRATRRREPEHVLLGTQLVGGQRRGAGRVDVSQPLPIPGMKALFRKPDGARQLGRFTETSKVERVLFRLGVTSLDLDELEMPPGEVTMRIFLPDE